MTSNVDWAIGMSILCVLVVVHGLSWVWFFLPSLLWLFFTVFDVLVGFFDG